MERKAQAAEEEIAHYRERALTAERRVAELEAKAEALKAEQDRIEQGLMQALSKLDSFEDMVLEMSTGTSAIEGASQVSEAADAQADAILQFQGLSEDDASHEGGGEAEESDEQTQPDSSSHDAPFQGGEHELDIF